MSAHTVLLLLRVCAQERLGVLHALDHATRLRLALAVAKSALKVVKAAASSKAGGGKFPFPLLGGSNGTRGPNGQVRGGYRRVWYNAHPILTLGVHLPSLRPCAPSLSCLCPCGPSLSPASARTAQPASCLHSCLYLKLKTYRAQATHTVAGLALRQQPVQPLQRLRRTC